MKIFEESNYCFDFTDAISAECFDKPNVQGLSAVDFVVETDTHLIFIEVKNPDNPRATEEKRREFRKELSEDKFPLTIGMKLKDSILKKYASGYKFHKPVKYVVVLQFGAFSEKEKGMLKVRILNHVPTGLGKGFSEFSKIDGFEMLTASEFSEKYFPASEVISI